MPFKVAWLQPANKQQSTPPTSASAQPAAAVAADSSRTTGDKEHRGFVGWVLSGGRGGPKTPGNVARGGGRRARGGPGRPPYSRTVRAAPGQLHRLSEASTLL